ncbi:amino acid ABC transporter substrate-binding protein [Pseudoalteromonas sp. JBTF-M23]|uniref:Amino acid ABC transporter substrate-binding protein n=1 Tax=Pseudoalteromonas caenipelagi TaxID=2726988 RepID=A0A849VJ61_9GAMM|nr:transporter substrate-binding domain-containing protein [Pseudoalteromonas caenipelagi]NOU51677.1 amino acid ABC transporter substrate-binding protein [Pseudoalteromonas caenipelagi]
MIKRLIISLVALMLVIPSVQANLSKLTGGHNPWSPYIEENGNGLIKDIVSAAYNAQNIEFEFKTAPFSRILMLADNHQIDLVAALWSTKQRRATMFYSTAYFYNQLVLISKNTNPIDYKGIASLRFRSVATVRGYGYHSLLDNIDELTITDVLNLHTCLELVVKDRVEVAIADYLAFEYERKTMAEFKQLDAYFPAIVRWPLYIGVSKSHPQAQQIITNFNLGLAKIQENGTYQAILAKYITDNRFK